jgi:hypothetical protein
MEEWSCEEYLDNKWGDKDANLPQKIKIEIMNECSFSIL